MRLREFDITGEKLDFVIIGPVRGQLGSIARFSYIPDLVTVSGSLLLDHLLGDGGAICLLKELVSVFHGYFAKTCRPGLIKTDIDKVVERY